MAPERLAEAQMDRDRLERELRESQLEIDALRARAEAAVSSLEEEIYPYTCTEGLHAV